MSQYIPDLEIVDFRNVQGRIASMDTVPTGVPKVMAEQIKVVKTGGNTYLYIYDNLTNAWKYKLLT